MSSISFLKGQKEVFQIEFSQFFGLRYVIHFIRNVRRVLMRSSILRILLLFVLAVCIVTYTLFVGQDRLSGTSWVSSDTCSAADCHVKLPLRHSELSPNLLIVLVHSSAKGSALRDVIRKTWMSASSNEPGSPIHHRFVIGVEGVVPSLLSRLLVENDEHHDLMLLHDVADSLFSLTNRTLKGYKYVHSKLPKFSYVLKCDDDSLVDLMRVASELQERKRPDRLYWGYMAGASRLMWFGAYSEYKWFVCDAYFPYALGGGYVLSKEVVELLVLNEKNLKIYTCEDTSLGSWLAPYNIEYKHDSRFNTQVPSRGCKDPYLIVHKVSSSDMVYYHDNFLREHKYCTWRTNWHNAYGYLYNWARLPSSCCHINTYVP